MLIFTWLLAYSCMLIADWILSYQHTQHFKRPNHSAKISAFKELLLPWQSRVLWKPSRRHPMIHTRNNVQTLPDASLRHKVYPVTTVPIFTCCNTRCQQYVTVHREPGLLENKSCIQKGGGRAVVGTPLSYYKADALKNEGQLNKTLKDFSLFKYLKTLS